MTASDRWSLQDWLQWQERLHARPIELGLDRVAAVAARLQILPAGAAVITVAGTNGKGSTVRILESILTRAGYRVGAYTSPHLLRYNERIRICDREVSDAPLCEAFRAVEDARQDTSLTYFEFGTLAALYLFKQADLDAWVLEIGLGGRLDAVNIIDPDLAIISSIGLDHQDWLGPDRESIGAEKAGIMRAGRLTVCGDRDPPAALGQLARSLGAGIEYLGREFEAEPRTGGMRWRMAGDAWTELPLPGIEGATQIDNAACAVRAMHALQARLPVSPMELAQGLAGARLPGRQQRVGQNPEIWLDVGHNPAALEALARQLRAEPAQGRTFVLIGMLRDKAVLESTAPLTDLVDRWYPATLDGPRAYPPGDLARLLGSHTGLHGIQAERPVAAAFAQALGDCAAGDRLIVCGSFLTVAAVLACMAEADPEQTGRATGTGAP